MKNEKEAIELWKKFHEIHTHGDHSAEFLHIVNNQPVSVSKHQNPTKLKNLEDALNKGDWHADIFKDKDLARLAISLFEPARITAYQFFTVLEYIQVIQAFDKVECFPILNEDGTFTEAAEKKLLPSIQDPWFLGCLTKDNVEAFRLLVKALPKSEQMFYVTDEDKVNSRLYQLLLRGDKIIPGIEKEKILVHLSSGAWDVLGLTQSGLEYVKPDRRFGILLPEDIRESVEKSERGASIYFPGAKFPSSVHSLEGEKRYLVLLHDKLHATYTSGLGKELTDVASRLRDVISTNTDFKISAEIWQLIDGIYNMPIPERIRACSYNDCKTYNQSTGNYEWDKEGKGRVKFLFKYILNWNQLAELEKAQIYEGLGKNGQYEMFDRPQATHLIDFAFFWDLEKNPSAWKKLNLTEESIKEYAGVKYRHFKSIYKEEDSFLMGWLKYELAFVLQHHESIFSGTDFSVLLEVLDKNKEEILKDIKIEKHTQGFKNALVLTYKGGPVFEYSDKRGLQLKPGKVMQLLLKSPGFKINEKNKQGDTALHTAMREGNYELAKLLISHGANINLPDENGCMALHIAAQKQDQKMINLLLRQPEIKINEVDKNNDTPLSIAEKNKDKNIVRLLQRALGIKLEESPHFPVKTPLLDFQSERDFYEQLLHLAKKDPSYFNLHLQLFGKDVNANTKDGYTLLHFSAYREQDLPVLKSLLKITELEINKENYAGNTALHLAAHIRNEDSLTLLLNAPGIKVNEENKNGEIPLHLAAQAQNARLAACLIRRGGDVHAADKFGRTPLHCAVRFNRQTIAELLINKGADVNEPNDDRETLLHLAIQEGAYDLVTMLIEKGGDVNVADKNGWMPLHFAISRGLDDIAKLLIEKGANVSAVTKNGKTPLHYAAERGNEKMAELLLKNKANVNAATEDGKTPLCCAILYKRDRIVDLLVKNGGNINAANNKELDTLLPYAKEQGYIKIANEIIITLNKKKFAAQPLLDLKGIIKRLEGYTGNGSTWIKFFSNRHHLGEVTAVLEKIGKEGISTPEALLNSLYEIGDKKGFTETSALAGIVAQLALLVDSRETLKPKPQSGL